MACFQPRVAVKDLLLPAASPSSVRALRTSPDHIYGILTQHSYIGVYLSDLVVNASLPSQVDPSSADAPLVLQPHTSHLIPANPLVFNSLRALPPGMRLQPLLNVNKHRRTAAIVKHVQTFQALARSDAHLVPGPAYSKVLKLRSLDSDIIRKCAAAIVDTQ